METKTNIATAEGYELPGWGVLSPDATLLASTVWDYDKDSVAKVEVWDVRTGRRIATLQGSGGKDQMLSFSPDGTSLACVSSYGVILWDESVALPEGGLKGRLQCIQKECLTGTIEFGGTTSSSSFLSSAPRAGRT